MSTVLCLSKRRTLELLTNLFSFVWGLWVINPYFNTFDSAPIFGIMRDVAPEPIWGFAFFITGLTGMIFFKTELLKIRLATNTMSMFLFITLSILMGVSDIRNTACPIYGIVALCSYFSASELFYELDKKKNITKVKI